MKAAADKLAEQLLVEEGTPEELKQALEVFLDFGDEIADPKRREEVITNLIKRYGMKTEDITTNYPSNFLAPLDKISNLSFEGKLHGRPKKVAMEKKGSAQTVTTLSFVDLDSSSIEISGKLNAYDREVHAAVVTLYAEGNEFITNQMIYRVITGDPNSRLSENQANEIEKSLNRCRTSLVKIDCSEERKYNYDHNLEFSYSDNLLAAEGWGVKLNGQFVSCLRIKNTPVLYRYALAKKQVATIPIKLLNSPVVKTKEIIMLQGYLSRRIARMKNSKSTSRNIKYETLYSELKAEEKTSSPNSLRNKQAKLRKHTKIILDHWRKEKYIKSYREVKKGRKIHGIFIKL